MFKLNPDQEKVCCPFNNSHVFSKQKLIFHISRCKDKTKVAHLFTVCRYNAMHFIKKEEIEIHQQICPDKQEVRKMTALMRRNYQDINRERERSRDKHKKEQKQKIKEDQQQDDDEHTLSECQECLQALKLIDIQQHPKLKKYLLKYEEINKKANK